ncbi:hypothetical protein KS4_31800 [Poriferisphaera corsica]|uniref:Uncharacterized protein n=1 Tax=Poriferisphaera corsica TaxID=2528020 RepID=A0A517YY05_9BACT|nr:hypothetical protein KS4_31800 [Poriferisphaera corsica]
MRREEKTEQSRVVGMDCAQICGVVSALNGGFCAHKSGEYWRFAAGLCAQIFKIRYLPVVKMDQKW